ncbi:MAG: nuclease [Saprospiraceae bacterium]|nr:nuclease [Saprospiraceae bacterium]
MFTNYKKISFYVFLSLFMTTWWGCVDQDFDEPPLDGLTTLTANATVAEVKTLHTIGQTAKRIDDDVIVEVTVGADDQTGNLFRQIAVQDATGGFLIRLNATGLFNTYAEGTVILLKLQGLYIGDYNGTYQINGSAEDPVEELLIKNHLFVKDRDQFVTPEVVTIEDLNDAARLDQLLSKVIQLDDVQFASASAGAPYADAVNRFSVNRDLEDCKGNSLVVRTSGFSDFAAELTPEGKGSFIGVLSVFRDTRQLLVRRPSDLQMASTRCGAGTGGESLVSIGEIRAAYDGGASGVGADTKVRGVVISDRANENWDGRNMVLQDGDKGIVIRFSDFHDFDLGEDVEVVVSEVEFSEFNGLLQLAGVTNAGATSNGAGTAPTPRSATISEILANAEAWESTLVEIKGATITGGNTYNGNLTITDASGSMSMFTRGAASFSGAAVPAGTTDIVAVVSEFNDPQVIIRNLDDISADGGGNVGGDNEPISAGELREIFEDGGTVAPNNKVLSGIVISDLSNENITGRNLVLQDGDRGIVLRFDAEHAFALGEELEVVVSAQELSEYNGLLQVNDVPLQNATTKGMGTLPTPREATLKQVADNLEEWESTLVVIKDVSFPSGTYAGSQTITDPSGSLTLFTRSQASFSGSTLPNGEVTLTAIVSEFNAAQLNIRNLTDIVEQ